MRKLLYISLLLLLAFRVDGQNKRSIDSLLNVKASLTDNDTGMVRVLNGLAWDISYYNLDSGLAIINHSLDLARRQQYAYGEAEAQNVAGTIYADLGRYPEAVNSHLQSIRIRDSIKCDPSKLGESYHNLALVYESMDSLKTSLRYQKMAYTYYHMGHDSSGIAPIANYLGRHYAEMDSIDQAKYYFEEGNYFAKAYKLKHWIAANTAGLAYCCAAKGNFRQADSLIAQAFLIGKSADNEYDMMAVWVYTSKLRQLQKNYPYAIAAMDSALRISTKLNVRDSRMNHLKMLAELHEASGNRRMALGYYQQYQSLKDSVLSSKNQQNIRNLETVYETQKTEKELAIAREDDRQQQIYVAGGIVCSVGFVVIAILLFGRIRMGKKAGLVLEQQKAIIESKNKDITDSINYARRIQDAVTPVEAQLRVLFPESFVFNSPRSIVSGDFWWIAETDSRYFLALGDCSGHGVPGGFMSVMAASFLNGIVIENKIHSPEEILFELNNKVRAALQHEGNGENTPLVSDTIEITVCSFSKTKNEMEFSSAGMPLILVRKSKLIEFRGSEFRAGTVAAATNPFTLNAATLEAGDQLFLFSDGIAALPGTDHNQLHDLLVSLDTKGDAAERAVRKFISDRCGKLEQPDDILVIGLKI